MLSNLSLKFKGIHISLKMKKEVLYVIWLIDQRRFCVISKELLSSFQNKNCLAIQEIKKFNLSASPLFSVYMSTWRMQAWLVELYNGISKWNIFLLLQPATEEAAHRRRNNRLLFLTEDVREFLFVLPKFPCSDVQEIIGGKLCGRDPPRTACVPK